MRVGQLFFITEDAAIKYKYKLNIIVLIKSRGDRFAVLKMCKDAYAAGHMASI